MNRGGKPVGIVYQWRTDHIEVVLVDKSYRPGIGDILYCRLPDRYILLQVAGYTGEVPISTGSLIRESRTPPPFYSVEVNMVAEARLFFEIRFLGGERGGYVVLKPYQPPPLFTMVYRLIPGDRESEDIMEKLSSGIRGGIDATPIAWLRSGIAPTEELRREKYFRNATLDLDLARSVVKHILVSGQTGAGKTTSVMGVMVQWARYSRSCIAWLVVDRHGEYSGVGGSGFVDIVYKALELNNGLDTSVYVYRFTTSIGSVGRGVYTEKLQAIHGTIDVTSVSVYDVANVLDLPPDKVSDLEEAVDIVGGLVKASSMPSEWKNVFISENGEPTGQILPLLSLLVENMFRYEGVGEQRKRGVYRVLLNAGIDIRKLRTYRRLLLSILGLSRRLVTVRSRSASGVSGDAEKPVTVVSDEMSVFKVSPLLKNPYTLVNIMEEIALAAKSSYDVDLDKRSYPWWGVRGGRGVSVLKEGLVEIDDIVKRVNEGNMVVLDVSKIPLRQGDVVVQSVIRRLFENRMNMGVEAMRQLPPIAIVSEEAPLYLSPDRVRSPYNVFARIAREGRKFGIGLIAITQLATMIEKQILANFNTMIALRTKYVSDINYYSNIGVPGETLTSLGDREGYLYTPDLRVKEPIPVYIPGYFELEESIVEEYRRKKERDRDVVEKGVESLVSSLSSIGGGED